jgi:hypothetical protein
MSDSGLRKVLEGGGGDGFAFTALKEGLRVTIDDYRAHHAAKL